MLDKIIMHFHQSILSVFYTTALIPFIYSFIHSFIHSFIQQLLLNSSFGPASCLQLSASKISLPCDFILLFYIPSVQSVHAYS